MTGRPSGREKCERGAPASGAPLDLVHARDGDEQQLEHMFRTYQPELFVFAMRFVRSADVARDLVQDVFFSVWRRRAVSALSGVSRAYLYTATRNAALVHLRHASVVARFEAAAGRELGEEGPSSSEALDRQEIVAAADRAVAALPERCRLVYTMSREHGLTNAEIARVLGVTPKAVEKQMTRAFRAIRVALGAYLSMLVLFSQ